MSVIERGPIGAVPGTPDNPRRTPAPPPEPTPFERAADRYALQGRGWWPRLR